MSDKNKKEKLIFGFDVGLGSLGVAVRKNDDIVEAHSYIIDADVGTTKDEAERRRAYRTRKAHKQREQWLEKVWKKNVGEESWLQGIQIKKTKDKNGKKSFKASAGDERLEREFPKKGDDTVYNSALLRIMLIEGKKLERWQIYKALHSAIQRREYDNSVPWKSNIDSKKQQIADEKKEILKEWNMEEDDIKTQDPLKNHPKYQLPCYYDAFRMGLWSPKKGIISIRQNHKAQKARHYTTLFIDREKVRKELELLLKGAEKQIPALKGKTEYILYGDGADPQKREYENTEKQPEYSFATKWEGVLAQKHPRFDNRCVSQCSRIVRPKGEFQFKSCRSNDPLFIKVHFLLQLNNVRYAIEGKTDSQRLSPQYITYIFKKCNEKLLKTTKNQKVNKIDRVVSCFYTNKRDLKKYIQEAYQEDGLDVKIDVSGTQINKASISGRCGYSRPALKLIYEMFLSEQQPQEFYKLVSKSLNTDKRFKKYNLGKEDIKFLLNIDKDERFYTGNNKIEKNIIGKKVKKQDRDQRVKDLIMDCRDPIVQHRLTFLVNEIKRLEGRYGEPEHIVFEFAREEKNDIYRKGVDKSDFKQHRKDLYKMRRDKNEEKNKKIKQLLKERNILNPSKQYFEKAKLLVDQNYKCLYTDDTLCFNELNNYDIDHIIPRKGGYNGPDAYWNKVLVSQKVNRQEKENKLPLEYLTGEERDNFINRIEAWQNESEGGGIKRVPPKKSVLLCKDKQQAEELVERYHPLAITGWIALLSRKLVILRFGWEQEGEEQRVHTIKGSWVGKTRRDYDIDEILYDKEYVEEYNKEEKNKKGKLQKNRDDDRHHALDAMIITYFTAKEFFKSEQKNINKKTNRFYFPQNVQKIGPKKYFENKLLDKAIVPTIKGPLMPELRYKASPKLIESPVGKRFVHNEKGIKEYVAVQREKIESIIVSSKKIDRIFDIHFKNKLERSVLKFQKRNSMVIKDKKDRDVIQIDTKDQDIINKAVDFVRQDLKMNIKTILLTADRKNIKQYADLKKDTDSKVLGYQGFTSRKEQGVGTRRKGFFICQNKENNEYELISVHSFDSIVEKERVLEKDGYIICLQGNIISKGSIIKTDKGVLYLEKTSNNNVFLKRFNNDYLRNEGNFTKESSNGCPIQYFMSLNPKLISTPK